MVKTKPVSLPAVPSLHNCSIRSSNSQLFLQFPSNHEVISFFLSFSCQVLKLLPLLPCPFLPISKVPILLLAIPPRNLLSYPLPSKGRQECSSQAQITTFSEFYHSSILQLILNKHCRKTATRSHVLSFPASWNPDVHWITHTANPARAPQLLRIECSLKPLLSSQQNMPSSLSSKVRKFTLLGNTSTHT